MRCCQSLIVILQLAGVPRPDGTIRVLRNIQKVSDETSLTLKEGHSIDRMSQQRRPTSYGPTIVVALPMGPIACYFCWIWWDVLGEAASQIYVSMPGRALKVKTSNS